MKLDDLYRDVILDHHRHPRGCHPLHHANASSSGLNPSCGDEVTVNLDIQGGSIAEIQVEGRGCAISTAAGSMLAERAKGLTVDELRGMTESLREMLKTGKLPEGLEIGDMEALQGVSRFPVRVKCAMLPLVTVMQAVDAFAAGVDPADVSTE